MLLDAFASYYYAAAMLPPLMLSPLFADADYSAAITLLHHAAAAAICLLFRRCFAMISRCC